MYDDNERYALTNDERSAGLGEFLRDKKTYFPYHQEATKTRNKSLKYPENHGKKWTDHETENVNNLFKSGLSIKEISNIKKRTPYAISWCLYNSKLINIEQRELVKSGNDKIHYLERESFTKKLNFIQASEPQKTTNNNYRQTQKNQSDKTKTIKAFMLIWVIVISINQVMFFNACLAPHCIIAAIPHTVIISALLTFFTRKNHKKHN